MSQNKKRKSSSGSQKDEVDRDSQAPKNPPFLTDKQYEAIEKLLPSLLYTPMSVPMESNASSTFFSRLHDDHEGTWTGSLVVGTSTDGDMWIRTTVPENVPLGMLRFRCPLNGGGMSHRTHVALRLLYLAILEDNRTHPIVAPTGKTIK